MNEPEPSYTTATYPDVEMKPGPPKLPVWMQRYLEQRHRALLTELHEIRMILGKPQLKEPRVR
jgi:hypothetical protein